MLAAAGELEPPDAQAQTGSAEEQPVGAWALEAPLLWARAPVVEGLAEARTVGGWAGSQAEPLLVTVRAVWAARAPAVKVRPAAAFRRDAIALDWPLAWRQPELPE